VLTALALTAKISKLTALLAQTLTPFTDARLTSLPLSVQLPVAKTMPTVLAHCKLTLVDTIRVLNISVRVASRILSINVGVDAFCINKHLQTTRVVIVQILNTFVRMAARVMDTCKHL
jgi:hypothetical protein